MVTTWDPAPQRPRPGWNTKWLVVLGEHVLGAFDRKREAEKSAAKVPGSRVEKRNNTLALGSGELRRGRIGF